jgi:hypothetical protein
MIREDLAALAFIAGIAIGAATMHFVRVDRALPEPLAETVQQHEVRSAVDTATTNRLERDAAAARFASKMASLRADALERTRQQLQRTADSLTAIAAASTSASDSAQGLAAALEARTAERDTLAAIVDVRSLQLRFEINRGDSLARANAIHKARGDRADAVIAAAMEVVRAADPPCRVARIVPCPSRKEAVIGGVLAGAAAVIAAGRLP